MKLELKKEYTNVKKSTRNLSKQIDKLVDKIEKHHFEIDEREFMFKTDKATELYNVLIKLCELNNSLMEFEK